MERWQANLALEAEEAANLCAICGQYGHYAVNCPLVWRPKPAVPKERWPAGYILLAGLLIGLIVGMLVMKAAMS